MADRYLSSMTEADLDEVAAIEKLAYEFPWTRGNFRTRCATAISAYACAT